MRKIVTPHPENSHQAPHSRSLAERRAEVHRNRKKNKKTGCLTYLFFIMLFIIAALAGMLFASTSLFDKPTNRPKDPEEQLLYATDKTIIMIMGIDQHIREDDEGRSDTLMVAMLDPHTDKAALLSIPRDTRVHIPGYGFDKINAAYSLGGQKLTQKTVERFLSIPIDHYVAIKTSSFCRIIDAIGGVDIDVEKRMFYEDPWDDNGGLVINLQPGMQHMDGKTAITYVRYRDEEGDIGRVKRQQKFMKAVMAQATSPSIIPRLPSIVREVSNTVDTDLTMRQLLELAGTLKNAAKNGLKTDMVDGQPLYIDDISYWVPDLSDVRETLAKTLDINLTQQMKDATDSEEGEYNASISGRRVYNDEGPVEVRRTPERRQEPSFDDVLKGNTGTKTAPRSNEDRDTEPEEKPKQAAPAKKVTAPSFRPATGKTR